MLRRTVGKQSSVVFASPSPLDSLITGIRSIHIHERRGKRVKKFSQQKREAEGNAARTLDRPNAKRTFPVVHPNSPYRKETPVVPRLFLKITNLKDNPGSHHSRKIVGRGIGSGLGKTCGKGHKGQNSRSGRGPPPGFEGGQTPLYKRVRKYGFKNFFRIEYQVLNLNHLQFVLDTGKLKQPEDRALTIRDLKTSGVFRNLNKPVKILGNGSDSFQGPPEGPPLDIEVQAISKSARDAIERAGGKVTTVYFNKLGLKTILRNEPEDIHIRFARPKAKKAHRYDVPVYVLPGTVDPTLLPKEANEEL